MTARTQVQHVYWYVSDLPQITLLEDTLRVERAENARLRIASAGGRGGWDDFLDGGEERRLSTRRRSTGDDGRGQVNSGNRVRVPSSGGNDPCTMMHVGASNIAVLLFRSDLGQRMGGMRGVLIAGVMRWLHVTG